MGDDDRSQFAKNLRFRELNHRERRRYVCLLREAS
jgi:hypothetical protein